MRRRWLLALALVVANLAGAHIYYVTQGVHFQADNVDFGKPPRKLGIYWTHYFGNDDSGYRAGTDYIGLRDDAGWEESDEPDPTAALQKMAEDFEGKGRYREALANYRKLAADPEGRNDFVVVRTEVLPEAIRRPGMAGLKDYLASTRPKGKPVLWGTKKLDRFLETYVRYDVAMKETSPVSDLEDFAERFPRSPRADAALISVPRRLLWEGPTIHQTEMETSSRTIRNLLKRYPKSRFRGAAYGWLGRIDYLKKRFPAAVAHYEKMAIHASSFEEEARAYESIAMCRLALKAPEAAAISFLKRFRFGPRNEQSITRSTLLSRIEGFDPVQANRFAALLVKDPDALPAYFDIRFDTTDTSSTSRANLARLAEAWIARHPRDPKAPYLRARIAEVHYGDARFAQADRVASRVLSGNAIPDARALANYVRGSCARRKSKFAVAERHYRAILREQRTYLKGAAREALAIVLERQNKLDGALDQFFALGYEWDAAYMLDVRMSPDQVARYAASHPGPRQALLRYSAGMRLMRDRKWAAARREFARLTKTQVRKLACLDPKDQERIRDYYDESAFLDPIAVLKELEQLDRARQTACGPEAKAAATLKMAQYYYAKRNLALYNPSLWRGMRALVIGHSWNNGLNMRADNEALKQHHYDHECMAQALSLVQEIAKKYPKTTAAPEAMWVGVNAAMRLATLNPWWRTEERKANHYGVAQNLCQILLKHHPGHALAARAKEKIAHLKEMSWEAHLSELEYGKYRKGAPGF